MDPIYRPLEKDNIVNAYFFFSFGVSFSSPKSTGVLPGFGLSQPRHAGNLLTFIDDHKMET